MSADPVIISGVKPSCLIPLEPSVSEIHFGVDFGAGDSYTQFHQIQIVKPFNPCKQCRESELDILKLRTGAVMPISSVPELKIEMVGQDPQAVEGLSDATKRILDAYAETCARWFSVMRSCIRRERIRQALFREENGLPAKAKVKYERQPQTADEVAISDMSEAIVRCLFGDEVARYAKDMFLRAIDTGDMRAFKIRLLIIKARKALEKDKSPFLKDFIAGIDRCIEKAESLAGCIPDPSPRRMSKAEKAKKLKREEDRRKLREMQPELPLIWDGTQSGETPIQDIDHCDSCTNTGDRVSTDVKTGILPEEDKNGAKHNCDSSNSKDIQDIGDVTVTVTGKRAPLRKIVRKAREYSSVDQILDDIKAGKIVPYESSDEICEDLVCGLLTPVEALMFTNALDRYSPNLDDIEDGEDIDMDGESLGFDEDDEVDGGKREMGSSCPFSYNPDGFSGSDKFDDEQDWD